MATTRPLVTLTSETMPGVPNDNGVACYQQHVSADETLEMAGSIMAHLSSGEPRRNSIVLADDMMYASDDDGGVRTPKTDPRRYSSAASSGRWTREEHEAFLQGLKEHGREWKKVADKIPTRNSAQIRSHAQKYFAKLAKEGHVHPLSLDSGSLIISNSVGHGLSESGLSSSVLAKIDQITRDPCAVQREVELTLKRLRERYRQLQVQLEHTRKLNGQRTMASLFTPSQIVGYATVAGPATAALALEGDVPESDFDLGSISAWTTSDAFPISINVKKCSADSLSSEGSVLIERESPAREFGSEELIALEVLRGGLPQAPTPPATFSTKSPTRPCGEVLSTRKRKVDVIPENTEHVLGGHPKRCRNA